MIFLSQEIQDIFQVKQVFIIVIIIIITTSYRYLL